MRLLASKQLKINKDEIKHYQHSSNKASENYKTLADQFQRSQDQLAQVRQKFAKLEAENKVLKERSTSLQSGDMDASPAQKAVTKKLTVPVDLANSSNQLFAGAVEWVLEGLEFEANSAHIKVSTQTTLQDLLGYMQKNPDNRIFIGRHSDSSGDDEKNRVLSEERAEQVHLYLIKNGINNKRVVSMG